MGTRFEIKVYTPVDGLGVQFVDKLYWRGESFLKAIFHLRKAKKSTGCATLYWRG